MADDGQIVGLTEPDSDAEKINEILKTRMEPIPEFRLRFHKTEGDKVLLILDVSKGEETPCPARQKHLLLFSGDALQGGGLSLFQAAGAL